MKTEFDNLGIFSWFGFDLPFPERLNIIAEAGFNSTFLWLGETETLFAAGQADQMPPLVRKAGLLLENAHATCSDCNLLWSDQDSENNLTVKEYLAALNFCNQHQIPVMVAHVTQGDSPPAKNDTGLKNIEFLVKRAEKSGVTIAIENIRKPDYIDFVLSSIDSPHLAFCYDSGHDLLYSSDFGAILAKWGKRLAATHFSDNDGTADQHILPQDGIIDWELVRTNFPADYCGTVSLEIVSGQSSGMQPREFIKTAYQRAAFLQQLLQVN